MAEDLPDLMTQLAQLVAIPSVSSANPELDQGNRAVIDILAGWLASLGFAIEIMPVSPSGHKANLLATLGQGSGGLVLAGHTDTVPYDANRWQGDPFRLRQVDGRLYGLGATDMKGFFPVAIEAIKAFLGKPLRAPLIVLATADEESSMCGARALVQAGRPKARAVVIGEPTGLRPVRMHKGIMMEGIRVLGQAGHSSNPALGKNALEAMHEVIAELLAYRARLQQQYHHPAFAIQYPTLNLGCIHGGDNPNRICNQCELHFDLRSLPGMDNERIRAEIRGLLVPVSERHGTPIELFDLFEGVSAYEEPANSELVAAVERLTGHVAEAVAFATEAPFMHELGMQTVVLGPGSIDQAHQPDEYMQVDQIMPAVAIYRHLIQQFCC